MSMLVQCLYAFPALGNNVFYYDLFITYVATSFPPSIYDTLSEKNLRAHYEFPDRTDGMLFAF